MDIIISRLAETRIKQLNTLKTQAIGGEFKKRIDIAVAMTQQSVALYNRMQRTLRASASEADHRRVAAGRLTVSGVGFSSRAQGSTLQKSYENVVRNGTRKLPAQVHSTADAVSAAAITPQAINMQSLLHSTILKQDPFKNWDRIFQVANILGVTTTTASFVASGGLAIALNAASAVATYTGGITLLKTNAPDFASEALKNYLSCTGAWIQKSNALIETVDPNGQWSFNDFH